MRVDTHIHTTDLSILPGEVGDSGGNVTFTVGDNFSPNDPTKPASVRQIWGLNLSRYNPAEQIEVTTTMYSQLRSLSLYRFYRIKFANWIKT